MGSFKIKPLKRGYLVWKNPERGPYRVQTHNSFKLPNIKNSHQDNNFMTGVNAHDSAIFKTVTDPKMLEFNKFI